MSSAISNIITYLFDATNGLVTKYFAWLTSESVLPYFAIGIAVSLLLLAVKVVRGAVWGN